MNLKQLKYFIKASETENLSRAAQSLNIAQTALGLQIRNLEEELGTELITRHSRGVGLTEAGRLFAERARQVQKLLDDTVQDIRELADPGRPRVNMGLTPSVMDLLGARVFDLAGTIGKVAAVQFVEGLSFRLVSALETAEIDCALAFNIAEDDHSSRYALLEERLFFVSAPDPEKSWQPISLEEALTPNLALLSHRDMIWQMVDETAQHYTLDMTVAFEVQSQSAIKKLVQQGAATSIMPYGAMAEEARKGLICARPIDCSRLSRTLYFVVSKTLDQRLLPALRKVLVPAILNEYSALLGDYAVHLPALASAEG
ncbi:hypothetical protein BV394_14815 [Brevirhabdus pacifica]|uniref:Uncharacterized protein n=1 Tax=Brevirhabdus pacifica TaxID=1267768 RepID=A0A1U7DLD1_9RHOB|nr:LysR family transcriptional regulator [Brevirhabdus pacifica]APX90827.1 hypothetical protein BV394_14815 [Brevirhabdus pacifica]OWU79604.1 hypothetical protein ATO5_00515 [Loktanella sp. 22II-4b]PJJ87285.1 LysR family nitrogen assimilation transcriptional regulator [Brevirhabdus pacifica]